MTPTFCAPRGSHCQERIFSQNRDKSLGVIWEWTVTGEVSPRRPKIWTKMYLTENLSEKPAIKGARHGLRILKSLTQIFQVLRLHSLLEKLSITWFILLVWSFKISNIRASSRPVSIIPSYWFSVVSVLVCPERKHINSIWWARGRLAHKVFASKKRKLAKCENKRKKAYN